MESLKSNIRDIPDFPQKGVIFKDIAPLLANGESFKQAIDLLRERYADKNIDCVVGVEARGFLFAAALAYSLGAGTVIVRKPGKLPYKTFKKTYSLEYGTDTVEIHQDAFKNGQEILVVDDVLATGGTVSATIDLIRSNFQVNIVELAFLIELDFLKGREKLGDHAIHSLLHY